ncbi:hypothetical protein H6P81_021443 [Aristolochia fimbriata]|uniref:photosystem I n=1 Tax=Aristolochia fimbriata TaxID=158543 RepID=A0AAV7DPW9_ARIFI|nr:hypothetical protein H6P81_021443 [Aristolochia fimbriata]
MGMAYILDSMDKGSNLIDRSRSTKVLSSGVASDPKDRSGPPIPTGENRPFDRGILKLRRLGLIKLLNIGNKQYRLLQSNKYVPCEIYLAGLFVCVVRKEEDSMIIRSPEPEVKIMVDRDPVKTSFEEWAKPGHFSRTIAKGPDTTTWIWNLHADAHDFDSHTSDLEEISRKVFSAHFGQLSIIFLWLSGMYFHGARFSNYEAWLSDPTHIGPSAQIWRASGITSELQLYCTAIGALVFAALMLFAGWFHYHKAAPKLAWFQDVESMLNHHLAGLLGLGSLSWAGHQVHVSLPINQFLDAGVDPKEIPLPHEFILNRDLLAQLYPSFAEGATPFFHHLELVKIRGISYFSGRIRPSNRGTNWGIGHSLKDILEAHKGPFTGQGHKGLYEILTTSWHAQLSLNLAMLGSSTIVVAHHMYSMPPYPYLATDYGTQLSLFTHHMWIGGFLIVGAAAHAAIFMVRDYDPTTRYNDLLDRVLRHRDAIISHLNWACIFLGFHSFGLYIHNDTMSALGRPQDMFSDTAIQLQPIFAQWVQNTHALAPSATAPGATTSTSLTWGGSDLVAVGGKVALLPIPLGTADFFCSRLIPDKANLGFRFPCDGPGRGEHANWKMQSDVWGSISDQGVSSTTINGWLRDFLWAQASQEDLKGIMALRFPRFSQGLAQDPTTRRIWFGIATAHDFESHDDITEERLYQNIFASHFGQLAIIFLWTSGNLFHVAWQGNFESWVQDPLHPKWKPSVSWFKNAESRLNHHLSGLFGVSSLAWTGHLVHVAIPGSRGQYVRWNNFLDVLPYPQGLGPLFTGQWNLYAQNPDSSSHLFGTSEGAGTSILTLLGGFHPQTQSLWLTDIAHHHLAIAFIFLVAGHMYRTNFGIGHSMKDLLEAHIPPGGRLGRGHKGLYDTINNSLHFQLGLALASLGVITSLVAQHMYSLPAYAFIAQDFTTQAALYTHHQYIAGFIMTGAFAHGAIFFIRDYNPEQNEDNVLARMLDHKEAIISHLSWASLFLGFHTLGLYVHNDVMLAFGTPEKQILIEPIFAQWVQSAHGKTSYGFDVLLSSTNGPAFNAGRSIWLPGWLNAVNENSNSLFLTIGPGDFLVHHAIALGLHTTTLILVKGALDARGSKLMPDKKDFGYSFPCDGPGRGGTCDISAWDAFYLAVFWMLNTIGWVTFFIGIGSTSRYGKELIETLAWAHERTPLANLIRWRDKPVALSIVQARLVGLAHFSVGYIFTYAAFLIASTSGKFG